MEIEQNDQLGEPKQQGNPIYEQDPPDDQVDNQDIDQENPAVNQDPLDIASVASLYQDLR